MMRSAWCFAMAKKKKEKKKKKKERNEEIKDQESERSLGTTRLGSHHGFSYIQFREGC
jgi:hypothetical protein